MNPVSAMAVSLSDLLARMDCPDEVPVWPGGGWGAGVSDWGCRLPLAFK